MKKIKNAVFWEVVPCRSGVNRRFGETSVHTRSRRLHIQEDGIFHSHRRENLKSYMEKIIPAELQRPVSL
jgi:hypothetical protein